VRTRVKHKVPQETDNCGSTLFNYENQTYVDLLSISQMQCAKNKTYTLQGNFYSENFDYIELKLFKCFNGTEGGTCRPQEEIDEFFQNNEMQFAFINTLFDFNDYTSPIKRFIDDSLFWELEPTRVKKANFFVKQSEAELEDDLLQLG